MGQLSSCMGQLSFTTLRYCAFWTGHTGSEHTLYSGPTTAPSGGPPRRRDRGGSNTRNECLIVKNEKKPKTKNQCVSHIIMHFLCMHTRLSLVKGWSRRCRTAVGMQMTLYKYTNKSDMKCYGTKYYDTYSRYKISHVLVWWSSTCSRSWASRCSGCLLPSYTAHISAWSEVPWGSHRENPLRL